MNDQNFTILYVEDNIQNIRLVQRMLQKNPNLHLIDAIDGASGLELAYQAKPDLILMDINLPDIDGLSIAQQLKNDPQMRHIPIIAITANAMVGDREQYLGGGCNGYLAKPISRTELINTLNYFLNL